MASGCSGLSIRTVACCAACRSGRRHAPTAQASARIWVAWLRGGSHMWRIRKVVERRIVPSSISPSAAPSTSNDQVTTRLASLA
jgi:hypothetical protein